MNKIFNGNSKRKVEGEILCFHRVFDTRNSSHEEWLKQRKLGIGSSDAAASIGISKYKPRTQLYFEKFGIGEVFQGNERTEAGNYMEEMIAKIFSDRTGIQVRNNNFIIQSVPFPFMRANLDREGTLDDGRKFVLEIKNSNQYMADSWEDGNIPQEYQFQLFHQLVCTGYDVGIFGVWIGGWKLKIIVVDLDYTSEYETLEEFQNAGYSVVEDLKGYTVPEYIKEDWSEIFELLVENERDFQNYIEHTSNLLEGITADDIRKDIILENVPPLQGTEAEYPYLLETHPAPKTDKIVDAGEKMDPILVEYKAVKASLKADAKREKELKALICGEIGDDTGLRRCTVDGTEFTCTWKVKGSSAFSEKKLAEAYPEVYEKYTEQKEVLNKKLLKKEQPDIYAEFQGSTRTLVVKEK